MRKTILTFLVLAAFTVGSVSPAYAVEKKKKPVPTKKKEDPKKKPTKPKADSKAKPKKKPPKYNDFVDKNKNGIDDRVENLKKKKGGKKPEKKKPPAN